MALCVWMLAESFFDNRRKEAALSGLTPASTPMTRGGLEDLWSDEEDEDDSRLHFTCLPMSAPLSWYFTPFLGFDYENRVYPPPLMLAACPHSKTQDAKDRSSTATDRSRGLGRARVEDQRLSRDRAVCNGTHMAAHGLPMLCRQAVNLGSFDVVLEARIH